MVNVFEYTDYRKYLEDYYNDKKAKNSSFSYNVLAAKAGFNDKSTVYGAITGRRNITRSIALKISQALKHNRYEAEYFENLVAFNQEEALEQKNQYFERMNQIKNYGKYASKAKETRKDQYEFYSKWHHSAIRSLIGMYGFKGDFEWLAKSVTPKITKKMAKNSVELLERLGLIKKKPNRDYELTDSHIDASEEVLKLAGQIFHKNMAELAEDAISSLPKNQRHFSGLTMGISEKTYDKVCEEIEDFRKRLVDIIDKDENTDRVYQLNFQYFPLSNTKIRK